MAWMDRAMSARVPVRPININIASREDAYKWGRDIGIAAGILAAKAVLSLTRIGAGGIIPLEAKKGITDGLIEGYRGTLGE